jgi:hypothetical protein
LYSRARSRWEGGVTVGLPKHASKGHDVCYHNSKLTVKGKIYMVVVLVASRECANSGRGLRSQFLDELALLDMISVRFAD